MVKIKNIVCLFTLVAGISAGQMWGMQKKSNQDTGIYVVADLIKDNKTTKMLLVTVECHPEFGEKYALPTTDRLESLENYGLQISQCKNSKLYKLSIESEIEPGIWFGRWEKIEKFDAYNKSTSYCYNKIGTPFKWIPLEKAPENWQTKVKELEKIVLQKPKDLPVTKAVESTNQQQPKKVVKQTPIATKQNIAEYTNPFASVLMSAFSGGATALLPTNKTSLAAACLCTLIASFDIGKGWKENYYMCTTGFIAMCLGRFLVRAAV